ncbi:YqjK-like family protein [Xenorhabdus bovienii]|uniref:Cell division protein FtsH n=2 Tax=Xenorhabdus bovienii TaxID=40576 RepID=A0A077PBX3_XENBV|nr:YqjK-like family protein [Xenorhabdus bovienii]MDE9432927.1 YqjK-like family protein [Xenorhabdus bovienii]MDE9445991.1 YqjK-like family protein [Xenorhabdus bovienii]MDE9452628.1 YqjK-like family protein [Xenorhabdus bovienii]MDE9490703.1 YqjK-like family protein [Xenorhabdus bovienii]MDE9506847.1 YqjK-like family protein [Xenorhabdus bovienii]
MNKSQRQQREWRKQQLLLEIQQQRQSLSGCTQHWLDITQPYDKGWQTLSAFKPYVAIGSGIALIYGICHPMKFYRWSRRMVSLLRLIRG